MRYDILAGLLGDDAYNDGDKMHKGARFVYRSRSAEGRNILETLNYLLYSGPAQDLVLRLWEVYTSPKWRIPHFCLSSLGELVGWAMPDRYCPRNGRTNKALYALGYKITLYGE